MGTGKIVQSLKLQLQREVHTLLSGIPRGPHRKKFTVLIKSLGGATLGGVGGDEAAPTMEGQEIPPESFPVLPPKGLFI